MDHDIGTTISELVCFPNWSSSGWEDENDSRCVEVRIRITRTPSGTYVYDYGITHRLPSGEQKVYTTTTEGAT